MAAVPAMGADAVLACLAASCGPREYCPLALRVPMASDLSITTGGATTPASSKTKQRRCATRAAPPDAITRHTGMNLSSRLGIRYAVFSEIAFMLSAPSGINITSPRL